MMVVLRPVGGVLFVLLIINASKFSLAEFCDPYIDRGNQLQEGFRCPVKEILPSSGKNFNGEESYCCGSCLYKFCCNTIENRVDQSDCDLAAPIMKAPPFGSNTKPENVSTRGGGKFKTKVKHEFEVIDPIADDGKRGDGMIKDKEPEKGLVDIATKGVKIMVDQAIDKAKEGDIGHMLGVIVGTAIAAIVLIACLIMCIVCCCKKSRKNINHQYRNHGVPLKGVTRSMSSASLHHGEGTGAKAEGKRHSALYPSIPNTPVAGGRYSSAGRLSKVRDYISYSLPHRAGREPRQPLWGEGGSRKSFNAQAFFSRQQMRNLQDRYVDGGDSDGTGTATPSPVHCGRKSMAGHCNTLHGGGMCTCHGGYGGGSHMCSGGACGGNHMAGTCGGAGGMRPQSCCVTGPNAGYSNYAPQPNIPGYNMPPTSHAMIPQAFANPYACPYPNPQYPNAGMPPTSGMVTPGSMQNQIPPSMVASYPPPNQTPAMSPFTSGLYPQVSQVLNDSATSPGQGPVMASGVQGLTDSEATQPTAPPPTGSLTQPPAFNPHYV